MSDMLSQAEIDALLNGTPVSDTDNTSESVLTAQEIDALGEIGNISMGTSATTLFTLLGQKVVITTPRVTETTWEELSKEYHLPFVAVRVEYTCGLTGSNLMIIGADDVKVITDLMMGGEGKNIEGDLTDLHLSAISEAMNQMVGSSCTSMSSIFNKRVEISPPKAFTIKFDTNQPYDIFEGSEKIVKIAFRMVIGNLIDSEIMQLMPANFAKNLVDNLLHIGTNDGNADMDEPKEEKPAQVHSPQVQQAANLPGMESVQQSYTQQMNYGGYSQDMPVHETAFQAPQRNREPVNVQPAFFQPFNDEKITLERKNISLILDVPLQVTVELGRTHKLIKDILEFGQGSVIELDKLAGEPVDILVNDKPIAKGEVVVIDESFAVRITDIIHPSKRL
jgi:flagellar motor switch protein FliN/FliY